MTCATCRFRDADDEELRQISEDPCRASDCQHHRNASGIIAALLCGTPMNSDGQAVTRQSDACACGKPARAKGQCAACYARANYVPGSRRKVAV